MENILEELKRITEDESIPTQLKIQTIRNYLDKHNLSPLEQIDIMEKLVEKTGQNSDNFQL